MKLSSLSEIWHWKILKNILKLQVVFLYIFVTRCELSLQAACQHSKNHCKGQIYIKLSQVFVHCLSLKQAGCSILLNPVQIICRTFRQLMAPDWYAYTCLATVVSHTLDDGWFTFDRPVKIIWLGKIKLTFLSDYI